MIIHIEKQPRIEFPSVAEILPFHEFNVTSWNRTYLYEDPSQLVINRFIVGDVEYVPNHVLVANYEPPVGGVQARFIVAELHSLRGLMEDIEFVGRGASLKASKLDWSMQVDTAIQRLFAKQDFERTSSEEKLWRGLGRFFDLNSIRYSIPLKIRAYGTLESIRGHRYIVRWLDSGRVNRLNRKDIPSAMVSFRCGQPFEAVVIRNARDFKLIGIESVFATSSLPRSTDEDASLLSKPVYDPAKYPTLDWE